MGILGSIGKAIGNVAPNISVGGHKFALPGINSALRVGSAALQGKNVGDAFGDEYSAGLRSAAVGAGAALAAPAAGTVASGGAAGGHAGLLANIGNALRGTFAPGGKPDVGRILGTVGGISDFFGKRKQRKGAERYNNAMIDQRNDLMSKILATPDYGINLNDQSSTGSGY